MPCHLIILLKSLSSSNFLIPARLKMSTTSDSVSNHVPKSFPLSEVAKRLQQLIREKTYRKLFWVSAEVASSIERNGNFYCDLVESDSSGKLVAKMNCRIWRDDYVALKERYKNDFRSELSLRDGSKVVLQCQVEYHPLWGLYLVAKDLDGTSLLGELAQKRQQIINNLKNDNLLEKNKSIAEAYLPKRIGLVASKNSASYKDFIQTLRRSEFGFQIVLADSIMESTQTESSVLASLDQLLLWELDLIIITRGGGSKVGLSILDNEQIARKIANFSLPVWSAIGHETDYGIVDMVASKFFRTPTAVAEALVAKHKEESAFLENAVQRLSYHFTESIRKERKDLNQARNMINIFVKNLLVDSSRVLHLSSSQFIMSVRNLLDRRSEMLSSFKATILQLSRNLMSLCFDELARNRYSLFVGAGRLVKSKKETFDLLVLRLDFSRFNEALALKYRGIKYCLEQLENLVSNILRFKAMNLSTANARFSEASYLSAINAQKVLLNTLKVAINSSEKNLMFRKNNSMVLNQSRKPVSSINQVRRGDQIITCIDDGEIISTIEGTRSRSND